MQSNEMVERIVCTEGTLLLSRRYMVVENKDGSIQPADLDEHEPYMAVVSLMRLVPSHEVEIQSGDMDVLRQLCLALAGEHPVLSVPLLGQCIMDKENRTIVNTVSPQSIEECIRVLCLIRSDGVYASDGNTYPFACREELFEVLCQYTDNQADASKMTESVRKGKLLSGAMRDEERYVVEDMLPKLPPALIEQLHNVRYLAKREPAALAIKYAAKAASYLKYDSSNSVM